MDTVGILIDCPKPLQIEIEELCINRGIDFTRYFLELHYGSQAAISTMKEHKEKGGNWQDTQLDPNELKTGKPDFEMTKKEMMDEHEKTLPKHNHKGKKK